MKKKLETKRKHNLYIRRIVAFFSFLLETILVIVTLFILINLGVEGYYYLIPLGLIVILDFILGLFVINTKVDIDFKASWLCVILILPFAGAILYLMFAHKITTKRRKKLQNNRISKYLKSIKKNSDKEINELFNINPNASVISRYIDSCSFSLFNNSNLTYYKSGEEGFPDILNALKKAQKFIFIEFFIVDEGIMFNSIYSILKEKANSGVKVIFIYDDFGTSSKLPGSFYKKVRKDNIECYAFNKISPTLNIRQNSRDHKKIIVIDGVIGFTGGCNLADEYINKVNRFGYRKDNFLRIKGEATEGLTISFALSYAFASRQYIDFSPFLYKNNLSLLKETIIPNSFIQPFSDIPFDNEDIAKEVYLGIISKATKYIIISTPYLIPDSSILVALKNAAKSGIDVSIITPGIPDKKAVYQITKSYYAELMLSGVKIYEFTPGFNHEKIIISDDILALTGTPNLDYRSLYLHFENALFIANSKEILKMKESLLEVISKSKKQELNDYVNASWLRRIYWSILRVFSPLC